MASEEERRRAHWRGTQRLTLALLGAWLLVTFVLPGLAREASFAFLGWPFPFFLASQGALLVYLAIVWVYAWRQGARDRASRQGDGA